MKAFKETGEATAFTINRIIELLKSNAHVLWFVTGGSSIAIAAEASIEIAKHNHKNLTVMLTDERYGPLEHKDSNWQGLLKAGFHLPEAKLIPILSGKKMEETIKEFNKAIEREFSMADYKIGLFGIGADGHTAGILPESPAVNSRELASGYRSETFERITITPRAIAKFDEIIVFAKGKEKWKTLDDLNIEIDIRVQPAQILKKAPLLTIFTDYKNN